jgi:hypothetical protein
MYVYQWRAGASDRFDSGLVRPDGTARPSYARMVRDLAAMATVSWSARWSTSRPRRIVLRATCPTVLARCRGRVILGVLGRRVAVRSYATTSSRRTAVLRIDVSRALWRRLRAASRRRLVLTVVPSVPAGTRARISLALARPTA